MNRLFFLPLTAVILLSQSCNKKDDTSNAPKAAFSATGYEAQVPCSVSFFNTSSNASSYFWSFGDGSTSTEFNPVHTFSFIGTYPIKLRVTGPDGVDSICKILSVDKVPAANKSAFSYFSDKCIGTPVGIAFKSLNPLSTNTVWDFGNGLVNTARDPIVQFLLPGDYTIKYSSAIGGVRDTVIRIIRIE
ncbi:MAG: PKD domain-containing protein [Bacteroidetes bacterium]|nr:PKD domain-containing protein [Bacteroidota bacterium]